MKKIAYFSLALALTACGGKTQMPEQSNDFTVEFMGGAFIDRKSVV